MINLRIGKIRYIDHPFLTSTKQIIGADSEKICNFTKHLNRRNDVIILPIGYALLGNAKDLGKLHLV